jgi:hypothetical protein
LGLPGLSSGGLLVLIPRVRGWELSPQLRTFSLFITGIQERVHLPILRPGAEDLRRSIVQRGRIAAVGILRRLL